MHIKDKKKKYIILVTNSGKKRTFGRVGHKWKDIIQWFFKKYDENVGWIHLVKGSVYRQARQQYMSEYSLYT